MSTADAAPTWSDIASWYDDLLEAGSGPHDTALECLLRLVPQGEAEAIMDLACGQGIATRALATTRTRRVVGVDASDAMIELARGHGAPGGAEVSYIVDDGQALSVFDDEMFDGVTCQLGLMDIENLEATLAAVHRVLKADGWFAFVIAHPCFLVPGATRQPGGDGRPGVNVSGYFEERFWRSANPAGVRRAGNYHRTLSTYLNSLVRSGFAIEVVDEPVASPLLAAQQPLYTEVPIFFAARARRI